MSVGGDTITIVTWVGTGTYTKLGVEIMTDSTVAIPGCSVQRQSQAEVTSNVDQTTEVRVVFGDDPRLLDLATNTEIRWRDKTYHLHGEIDAETDIEGGTVSHVRFLMRRG